jgi:predicted nucleotidyltransferase
MCLYGSVVRGSFNEESDIDVLLVISNLPLEIDLRIARVTDLKMEIKKTEIYMMLKSRRLPTLMSDVILTPEEVSSHQLILLDIVEDGLILYDKD